MKKIIAIMMLSTFFLASSFAASNNSPKNEATTPYYNGGFNFGLASYITSSEYAQTDSYDSDEMSLSDAEECK